MRFLQLAANLVAEKAIYAISEISLRVISSKFALKAILQCAILQCAILQCAILQCAIFACAIFACAIFACAILPYPKLGTQQFATQHIVGYAAILRSISSIGYALSRSLYSMATLNTISYLIVMIAYFISYI